MVCIILFFACCLLVCCSVRVWAIQQSYVYWRQINIFSSLT